jgi:TetR/AcrR family transcriptional regulator, fatty acid metabolism regulator protein
MKKDLSDRQLEIIEASGKILMAKGLMGLTTKNLAAEMGFSESALYRHFANKDAIILLLIQFLGNNVNQRFDVILNSDKNPVEKFVALFESHFRFFNKNPHFLVIILSDGIIDVSDEIKQSIVDLAQLNSDSIEKMIKEGQESRFFTKSISSNDLVHISSASFRHLMLKWKLSGFTFDIEKEGNRLIQSILTLISTN